MSNATGQRCFAQRAPLSGPPLIQSGQLVLQTHDIGWIIAGIFTIVATAVSFWLIAKHLTWYTTKRQQRYIIRLLLMVPIYAIVSLASYIFWNHAVAITLVRDSYESFVLYSFFYLLLQYLSPTSEGQKEVFRNVVLKKWIFPLGSIKYKPRDGLYFLQLMKWGVLQYCIVRPTTTLAAVILDFIGLYCDSSWSPDWGHVYITIIVSLSVTIAMYCLFQLYIPIAEQLAPQRPLLKLFSVKAVVFLTFWQATALSLFSMFGVVKDTPYMTANDINTGIAALLETFEMMCFAFLHIRAFSYIPYLPKGQSRSDRMSRLRSLIHALDIRDMWREIRDGFVYMGKAVRGLEVDEEARRRIHFSKVMSHERDFNEPKEDGKESLPTHRNFYDEELLLDRHTSESYSRKGVWLNNTGVASEDDVQQEHRTRESEEFGILYEPTFNVVQAHTRGNRSWWKGIYGRLSQSGSDREREERLSPIPQRPSQQHRNLFSVSRVPSLNSPPPPPSVIYDYYSLDNTRSSVRPFPYKREQLAIAPNQLQNSRVGNNRSSYGDMGNLTFSTRAGDLIAPRAMSIPYTISSKQTRSSEGPVSRNDYDGNLAITRSDSLLARIFPNSTSATVDSHVSSRGRADPVPCRTTHSSSTAFPVPLSWTPPEHVSPRRPRGSQKQSPKRRPPRPPIVLPAPLSPVCRLAVEVPRHAPEQASQPSAGRRSFQEPRRAGRHTSSSQDLSELASPSSARLGRFHPFQPERRGIGAARRRSNQEELPSALNIGPGTTHVIIPVGTRNFQAYVLPQSPTVEDGDVVPSVQSDLSKPLASSMTTIPISTTPPSSPISPRRLRHTRGDVGALRESWS